MKKIAILFLIVVLLAGCGSKTITCEECGETKKGKTYTITMLGQEIKEDICDDCFKIVKPLVEAVGGSIK